MRVLALLSLLLLQACAGYQSRPAGGGYGFAPAAGGGSYLHDGFYNGGAVDPDVTAPRPGESP